MLEVLEERNHGNVVEKKHGVLIKQMTKADFLQPRANKGRAGSKPRPLENTLSLRCLLEKTDQEPTGPKILPRNHTLNSAAFISGPVAYFNLVSMALTAPDVGLR